jgi:hypothetical protein
VRHKFRIFRQLRADTATRRILENRIQTLIAKCNNTLLRNSHRSRITEPERMVLRRATPVARERARSVYSQGGNAADRQDAYATLLAIERVALTVIVCLYFAR